MPHHDADSTLVDASDAGPGAEAAADRQVSVDDSGHRTAPTDARYESVKTIGEGGMGRIILARDRELRRKVAVKQLKAELSGKPDVAGRFLKEVRITAQLDHPNVIPVYGLEVDPAGGISYAMKLIEGRTLEDVLDETRALHREGRPLDEEHSLPARLDIFLKVCDAIAYAHSKGVLHRDLKPPNIMIGRYREVYVMDWGIARLMDGREEKPQDPVELAAAADADEAAELTLAGQIVGTPRYMSPEQAEGVSKELDGRSDVYALGLVLFELVSLRRAVPGATLAETLVHAQMASKEPLVHADTSVRIPSELQAIVNRATMPRREDRYAGVAELADDLRRHLRGEAVLARPDDPLQKLMRAMSRHRERTLAALMAVVLVGVSAFAWSEYRRAAAEQSAVVHELKVKQLLTDVSRQGQRIDARFLRLEGALEGLATAAIWALTRGPQPDAPVYTGTDFATPGQQPPDLGRTKNYRWPVSLEWPVSVLRPGLSREEIDPKLQRLSPLRSHFRKMFLESVPEGRTPLPPGRERELLGDEGVALDFAYVVLAEGVLHMYPGMGTCPPGYDPLAAGFYTLSAHKHGKFWGSPYVDATEDPDGDELMLPCTTSLYDDAGTFLGVAGVEMTFTRIVDQLLRLENTPAVIETTLLDDEGRKIVDSRDRGKRFRAAKTDAGVELFPFAIPEVVEAVKQRRSGTLEIVRDGRPELVAFFRLDMKGWYYVVEVDAREYLRE